MIATAETLAAQLDDAEALLVDARSSIAKGEGTLHLRPISELGLTMLLKVAVGYPEATDSELADMLEARLHRVRNLRGCGHCHAQSCHGQKAPKPH